MVKPSFPEVSPHHVLRRSIPRQPSDLTQVPSAGSWSHLECDPGDPFLVVGSCHASTTRTCPLRSISIFGRGCDVSSWDRLPLIGCAVIEKDRPSCPSSRSLIHVVALVRRWTQGHCSRTDGQCWNCRLPLYPEDHLAIWWDPLVAVAILRVKDSHSPQIALALPTQDQS